MLSSATRDNQATTRLHQEEVILPSVGTEPMGAVSG